jgi:hypothetical protein
MDRSVIGHWREIQKKFLIFDFFFRFFSSVELQQFIGGRLRKSSMASSQQYFTFGSTSFDDGSHWTV